MRLGFCTLKLFGVAATVATLLVLTDPAEAARVARVKGKQVIVQLEPSDKIASGDRLFAVVNGKRRAIIQITRVKGNRALGRVIKGRATVNATIEARSGEKKSQAASPSSRPADTGSSSGSFFDGLTYGLLAGMSLDSQTVKWTPAGSAASESISMSGTGFSLKGFGDIPIADAFGIIARLGLEQFNVQGTTTLGEKTTEITYATADLLARYRLMEGSFVPYVMGGLGLHFPLAKASGTLEVSRISATTVFFAGGGVNYDLSETMHVTAVAEYGLFPPSNDVTTNFIAIRGGVGFKF